jgi:hypothetical protein
MGTRFGNVDSLASPKRDKLISLDGQSELLIGGAGK